ncbi:MAG TPA: hypothetical protein VGK48_25665 [Terriglobia bacterium]
MNLHYILYMLLGPLAEACAAEAAAVAANAQVAIAIVDGNGDLVYSEGMDGAPA